MNLSEEATVPEAAAFLNVKQETVRRNIANVVYQLSSVVYSGYPPRRIDKLCQ